MSKVRSRNYPSMSLGAAIERARELYRKEGRARIDATSAVAAWGYKSQNGASLRVLSALRQFGLLEGGNEEIRLSETGLTLILEPEGSQDYADALSRAFGQPAIFAEIVEEFGQDVPSDGALISYLVRKKNLGEPAAKMLVAAFRESLEIVSVKQTLSLRAEKQSNAVEQAHIIEQPNAMQNIEIRQQKPSTGLSFSWPLSTNTVLVISIEGNIPSRDDIEDLPALLDLAKTKIQREVDKAARVVSDADYTVEGP